MYVGDVLDDGTERRVPSWRNWYEVIRTRNAVVLLLSCDDGTERWVDRVTISNWTLVDSGESRRCAELRVRLEEIGAKLHVACEDATGMGLLATRIRQSLEKLDEAVELCNGD